MVGVVVWGYLLFCAVGRAPVHLWERVCGYGGCGGLDCMMRCAVELGCRRGDFRAMFVTLGPSAALP